MNSEQTHKSTNRVAQALPVLSVVTFWLLPFSPLVAWFAMSETKGTRGWQRTMAVTGTILCTAYAAIVVGWVGWLTFDTLIDIGSSVQF
ncbi:MAG: hypothetical protein KDA93_06385 [Planctomycetaceae bacterium]|nr:hypothetical protein [Planctomycetaceae bacterium]